jgi:Protein of unknown function (DUF3237)
MLNNEFLLAAQVTIAKGVDAGLTPGGMRRIVPITGGSFEGPRLRGTVIPGGEDRQLFRPDGVLEVEASYALRTHDGEVIVVTNRGLWHGSPEVGARIVQGEVVDPTLYYFRTCARLEAPVGGSYAWLNRTVIIGSVAPRAELVSVEFFTLT